MEAFRFILLLLGAMAGLCGCQQQTNNRPHVVVCGDDQVLIIQPGLSDQEKSRVVWQWKVEEAKMQIPEKYVRLMIPLDECKPVDNASKLLLTSSGGGALLLDKTTKECLFYADVPMAHSAELLPEGKIAIALSTHPQGNSLEVYDINRPDQMLFRDSLYSGHGVVWMPQEKRLYALGFNELRAYEVHALPGDSVSLSLDKAWTLPSDNGHELSIINDHELLVSTYEHVYRFDTQSGSFAPFAPLADVKDVKSANYCETTGLLIYTKAETSWWTNHVYIQQKDETSVITIDSIHVYKARVYYGPK